MIRICAWCNRPMGEKEPFDDKSITHGMCEKCADNMEASVVSQKKTLFVDGTKGVND